MGHLDAFGLLVCSGGLKILGARVGSKPNLRFWDIFIEVLIVEPPVLHRGYDLFNCRNPHRRRFGHFLVLVFRGLSLALSLFFGE
jgi:hypothetical protein